jgi:uncharacterized protein YcbK (DUF882 family)
VARIDIWAASVLALATALTYPAHAEREHTVRAGQSLRAIARSYHIDVASLAAANARRPDGVLREGEILHVPPKGVIVLGEGDTLWSIARAHGCTVAALARANGLQASSALHPGMRLTLPGATDPRSTTRSTLAAKASSKDKGSNKATAKLFRVATDEHLTITLTDERGRVRPEAPQKLARFLRPRHSTKQRRPDPRLIGLLAEIARHYEGHTISVISGYRLPGGFTSNESRHTQGKAIDLRVEGVPVRALRDYLRRFSQVGVGFYPNSGFVHLDVRDKNAYWIDLSSPGRQPSYLDREQRAYFDGGSRGEGLSALGASVEQAIGELEVREQAPSNE